MPSAADASQQGAPASTGWVDDEMNVDAPAPAPAAVAADDDDFYWEQLPSELVAHLFSCLKFTDLCAAARVCRQWREVSAHEEFWKVMDVADKEVPMATVLALCTRFPLVEGLQLGVVPMSDARAFFDSPLMPLAHLTALSFGVLENTHALLAAIHTNFPQLLTLEIASADFRHKPSTNLTVNHRRLKRLRVGHRAVPVGVPISYGDRLTLTCPALTHLALDAMEHTRLDLRTPELRHLEIPNHKLASAVQLREALAVGTGPGDFLAALHCAPTPSRPVPHTPTCVPRIPPPGATTSRVSPSTVPLRSALLRTAGYSTLNPAS